MATVYRATQLAMGRPVALKILKQDFSSKERVVGRLMREARIAARFNHRHIVRAHDAGVQGDLCFFVMELVDGVSVRDLTERKGPLSEAEVVRIGIQITEALIQLRKEHVVHRDIKPANILIDQDGMALLADLGLAKLEFDASMTSKDHAVGTPAYMSPEQIQDPDHLDARADIYSLGASLYAMLTGDSPHRGANVGETISKILYEEPTPLRSINPEVSPELEAVIHRMLAKDRRERQDSPSLLLRDLLAVEAGRRPPSATAAARRARMRARMWAGGALLVLLTAGFAFWAIRGGEGREHDADLASPPSDRADLPLEARATSDLIALIATGTEEEKRRAASLLEERCEPVLVEQIERAKKAVRSGDDEGARRILEVDLTPAIARRLGVEYGTLPAPLRSRVDQRRLQGLELILAMASKRRGADRAALRTLLEEKAAEFEGEYASPEDLRVFLSKAAERETRWELPPVDRDAIVTEVVRASVRGWADEIDRRIELIRALGRSHRFLTARSSLAALTAKHPERIETGMARRIESIGDSLRREEKELSRTATFLLKGIDVAPAAGHPELAKLDTKSALSELKTFLESVPENDDELGGAAPAVRLVRDMVRTLVSVSQWRDALHEALESRVGGPPLRVEVRGEEPIEMARLLGVDGDDLTFHVENSPKVLEAPIWEMNPSWLFDLQPLEDEKARALVFLLLEDELSAEQSLSSLPKGDPFVEDLRPKVIRAFELRNDVRTPAEKEAFVLFSRAMRARGERRIDEALKILDELVKRRDLTRTPWFRKNAKAIRRLQSDVASQRRRDELSKRFHGRVNLTPAGDSPMHLELFYDFEDAAQAGDFLLPLSGWVGKASLERKLPEPQHRVRPDQVAPVVLETPIDPALGLVRVDLALKTSEDRAEAPRCFTLSIGDEHIAFVGALRRSGMYRHLPLHGLEWAIPSRWDVHRIVYWKGPLEEVVPLLGDPSSWPQFRLEPARTYAISLARDPASKTLTLAVDGNVVLRRRNLDAPPSSGTLRIHEAMPWALESLRMAGFLAP